MTTVVDASGLRDAVRTYRSTVAAIAAELVRDDLVLKAPRGEDAMHGPASLQESATLELVEDGGDVSVWRVSFTAEYASYVDEGTSGHPIEGNPLLVFYSKSAQKVIFTRRVQHPGTRAQPWFTDGTAAPAWEQACSDAVARVG